LIARYAQAPALAVVHCIFRIALHATIHDHTANCFCAIHLRSTAALRRNHTHPQDKLARYAPHNQTNAQIPKPFGVLN